MSALKKLLAWHPKNHGQEYVQGWYCMPRWKPLRRVLQWLCGALGGHEASKTEWGYSGGDCVDGNCRWCDAHIAIRAESARFMFDGFNDRRGHFGQAGEQE